MIRPEQIPPQQGWLTKERVEYFRALVEAVLLALALPYIAIRVLRAPARSAATIGAKRVG